MKHYCICPNLAHRSFKECEAYNRGVEDGSSAERARIVAWLPTRYEKAEGQTVTNTKPKPRRTDLEELEIVAKGHEAAGRKFSAWETFNAIAELQAARDVISAAIGSLPADWRHTTNLNAWQRPLQNALNVYLKEFGEEE